MDNLKERCGKFRCPNPRWENSFYCLHHYVLRGLLKFNLVKKLTGPSRPKTSLSLKNWTGLRSHYIAFFSARAQRLAKGELLPLSDPRLCIAIALSIHPQARPFNLRLVLAHWLRLIEYLWQFDHRIYHHVFLKEKWRVPNRFSSRITSRLDRRAK